VGRVFVEVPEESVTQGNYLWCEIWGFHGRENSSRGLLGCDAVLLCYGRISWRWRQHEPPKRWYPTTTPHGVTTQKTSTFTFTCLFNAGFMLNDTSVQTMLDKRVYSLMHVQTILQKSKETQKPLLVV